MQRRFPDRDHFDLDPVRILDFVRDPTHGNSESGGVDVGCFIEPVAKFALLAPGQSQDA